MIRQMLNRQNFPLLATIGVCILLYGLACLSFSGFCTSRVFIGFLGDNAFLGIAAIGLTFVILSGGIDLSVGAVVGCGSILIATLIEHAHWPPLLAIALVLGLGVLLGLAMGCLIQVFALPPFLVTLGGLFFCRGIGLLVSLESIAINHPTYQKLSLLELPLGGDVTVPLPALVFLGLLLVAIYISLWTRFGRNVYAIGGNETSALLMGLPLQSTKIRLYALSGFCSALAGVVYSIYTSSGNALAGTGLELDAVAAVVVGGTLLSGGVGQVAGTLVGVIIFAIIQTAITFQGTLSSWWTRIAVGVLLLSFILIQKLIQRKGN
jgi:simple sugar transport system permease protein